MCKSRPGPRCSDHPRKKVMKSILANNKANEQIIYYTAKRAELDPSASNYADRYEAISKQIDKANTTFNKTSESVAFWEQEYESTPDGMRDLQTKLDNPELSKVDRAHLEVDLEVAKMRRQWQLDFSKILARTEKGVEGVEGAIKLAEFEKENIAVKNSNLQQVEVEEQKELSNLEKEKKVLQKKYEADPSDSNRRKLEKNKTRLAQLRKTMYRIQKIYSLYQIISKDLDKFIKNRKNSLLQKTMIGTTALIMDFVLSSDDRKQAKAAKRATKEAPVE